MGINGICLNLGIGNGPGLSGGLDSTLALLVCIHALDLLRRQRSDILAATLPGPGSTLRTQNNAERLATLLGTDSVTIPVSDAVDQHLRIVGHSPETRDTVYENVQARERTQILMTLANRHDGLVVGTGDLSESALGWCTYNGDHMSMYHVNCSIPKTLVRYLIEWAAESLFEGSVAVVLRDICATPISPELLPPTFAGDIAQMTEDIVGPYELHDYFLYHMVRLGSPPEKILYLAEIAFAEAYDLATIKKWLELFIRRFFSQQFKRSAVPDGPKVGSVALSPRGDWRMPSDACADSWLAWCSK